MNRQHHLRYLFIIITIGLLCCASACSKGAPKTDARALFCAENEILTYEPVDLDKTVITIGLLTFSDIRPLESAIEARFPDVDIIPLQQASAIEYYLYKKYNIEKNDLADIIIASPDTQRREDIFYDLSSEEFTERYNLSALNELSQNGKLYQLPVSNTADGIYYNKTLFEQHGWEIPATIDEFYELCEVISAEGIRPFVPCFKYSVRGVGLGFSNRTIFSDLEKKVQYDKFAKGEASCKGLLEPYYEVLKTLYDKGIVVESDFSSSLTQNRQALYEGKIAMLPERLDMFALYQQEQPDCEIDFIGYFTDTPNERWMQLIPGRIMLLSKQAMEDPDKKQVLLDIFDFLSTNEGQDALLQCYTGLSSLTAYQTDLKEEIRDVQNCIDKGQIFFADTFASDDNNDVVKQWMMGNMTMDEIIAETDEFHQRDIERQKKDVSIGTATETFTMLETSSFIADTMKNAAGADIALVLHANYYKGNYAKIYQGDILNPRQFYLRSFSADDYLTTYEITGANLKKLMEFPIINGENVNAMYAFSGLKMEYAPWYPTDRNVISLTLEDGSDIDDDTVYTVAAWASSIDDSYISSTVCTHKEAGSNVDLMTFAIKQAGTISPPKDDRIKLKWE